MTQAATETQAAPSGSTHDVDAGTRRRNWITALVLVGFFTLLILGAFILPRLNTQAQPDLEHVDGAPSSWPARNLAPPPRRPTPPGR